MTDRVCTNCRFLMGYPPAEPVPVGVVGRCARHPPLVADGLRRPTVYAGDWCGEWRPQLTPLQADAARLALAVLANPDDLIPVCQLADDLAGRLAAGET
jgi:hypothetical protein